MATWLAWHQREGHPKVYARAHCFEKNSSVADHKQHPPSPTSIHHPQFWTELTLHSLASYIEFGIEAMFSLLLNTASQIISF